MITLSVDIDTNHLDYTLTPKDLERLTRSQTNNVLKLIKDNFKSLGGRQFYQDAAASTTGKALNNTALITVDKVGVGLRWQGGEVRPGRHKSSKTGNPTKALAIPTTDSALWPADLGKMLSFVPLKKKGKAIGLLVEAEQHTIKKGKRKGVQITAPKPGGNVYYLLVSSTTHPADPHVMPSDLEFHDNIQATTYTYLDILTRRKQ